MRPMWRPSWFLLVEVRASGRRIWIPVPILVVEDLLVAIEPWGWLFDRLVWRRLGDAIRNRYGGWPKTPATGLLEVARAALRSLRGLGPFTLVDVTAAGGERVRIRLV